jgi:alpha-L-fucosidase
LVNSRLGLSIEEDPDIDFKTLGDNQIGNKKEGFPWQSPATVAHSWGFHATDSEWKSSSTLLKNLINNASLNGNLMLNIGPRADGNVPFEISQRMLEMGKWLEINGESIYGTEAFDLNKDLHDWGKITCKASGEKFKLYLHVFNWPLNEKFYLTGISDSPNKIYLLSDKQKSPLQFSQSGPVAVIKLPALQPDPYISVLVAEFDKKPLISDGLAAKTVDGGYSLTPKNSNPKNESISISRKEREGTVPEFAAIDSQSTLKWKIYVDEPGEKTIDVSYSYQNNSDKNYLTVKAANIHLSHTILPTGKTVGEPNQNWVIDNFKSNRLGKINFPEKGFYEIEFEVTTEKNDEIKFQWIWIN